jgi:hypothetical protein
VTLGCEHIATLQGKTWQNHGKNMAKPWQNQETWQPNIMEFPVDIPANASSVSPKNRRQSSRQSTFARGERSGGVLLVGSVVSLMG